MSWNKEEIRKIQNLMDENPSLLNQVHTLETIKPNSTLHEVLQKIDELYPFPGNSALEKNPAKRSRPNKNSHRDVQEQSGSHSDDDIIDLEAINQITGSIQNQFVYLRDLPKGVPKKIISMKVVPTSHGERLNAELEGGITCKLPKSAIYNLKPISGKMTSGLYSLVFTGQRDLGNNKKIDLYNIVKN